MLRQTQGSLGLWGTYPLYLLLRKKVKERRPCLLCRFVYHGTISLYYFLKAIPYLNDGSYYGYNYRRKIISKVFYSIL
jgi:hypothetical protein